MVIGLLGHNKVAAASAGDSVMHELCLEASWKLDKRKLGVWQHLAACGWQDAVPAAALSLRTDAQLFRRQRFRLPDGSEQRQD